jgi:hypothetical protein
MEKWKEYHIIDYGIFYMLESITDIDKLTRLLLVLYRDTCLVSY